MVPFPNLGRARPMSDSGQLLAITAGATESVTVPTGAKFVVITSDAAATVRPGAAPGAFGDISDGSAGELLSSGVPKEFELNGVTAIHARAGGANANVNFSFYGQP